MREAAHRLLGAGAALAAAAGLVAGSVVLARPPLAALPSLAVAGRMPFDALLAGCAAAGLLLAAVWLAVTLLATVVEALTGVGSAAVAAVTPAFLRRLVAVGCGVALSGGSTLGAAAATVADGSSDRTTVQAAGAGAGLAGGAVTPPRVGAPLTGLPLPDRALGRGGPRRAAHAPATRYLVRPADSLWSVAARRLPDATPAEVDAAWRLIYRASRSTVGDDPDLLLPGTTLLIPTRLSEPADDHPRKDDR